jgi:branched-chain amino acid transport system ATP-binding protein
MTVRENLEMGAVGIKDADFVAGRIAYVYKRFPVLKEKENDLALTLSGGQKQMLALGRALMREPSLLLLDEPSLGLSPKAINELFSILTKLKKEEELSILIVEQNAKKAIEMADRTYLLEDGKIALEGGREIIKHDKIRKVYLGGY